MASAREIAAIEFTIYFSKFPSVQILTFAANNDSICG